MTSCSVPGCARKKVVKNLCGGHYQRLVKFGDVQADRPFKKTRNDARCSVAGCDRMARRNGMCHAHSTRVLRCGDAQAAQAIAAKGEYGAGHVNKGGYRIMRSDGRHTGEHRLIGEAYLGRELTRSETVHHRNGQRAENTIGPCFLSPECRCPGGRHNLELWSKAQVPGQRVADKLQWARELTTTYEDDETFLEASAFADSVLAVVAQPIAA